MADKINVFISSIIDGMRKERKIVSDAINGRDFLNAILAEELPADEKEPREVCREKVQKCHIYVGIFDKKWGKIPEKDNPDSLSISAMEYYWAKEKELPLLIFYSDIDENLRDSKLKDFLKKVTDIDEGHWCKKYNSFIQLRELVLAAISNKIVERFHRGDRIVTSMSSETLKSVDSEKRKRDTIAKDLLAEVLENKTKVSLIPAGSLQNFDTHIWNSHRGELDFLGSPAGTSLRNVYVTMKEQNNYLNAITDARDRLTQRSWESKYTKKEKLTYITEHLDFCAKILFDYLAISGDYAPL